MEGVAKAVLEDGTQLLVQRFSFEGPASGATGSMSKSCQTDGLPSQGEHLRVRKESAATQTDDATQASCAVQTQPCWPASTGVGVSTASTATAMPPDDFATPGYIDGSSTSGASYPGTVPGYFPPGHPGHAAYHHHHHHHHHPPLYYPPDNPSLFGWSKSKFSSADIAYLVYIF